MDKFIISKNKELNYSYSIELNKNFSLYSNIRPEILFKGKIKYLFWKNKWFFDKGKFND